MEMDTGYRASRCRCHHGTAYGPHSFSLFTWASACCCTGSCVKIKKKVPKSSRLGTPLYKGKREFVTLSLYH